MIYLFLAEGFEEIEALTPIDILRRAGLSVKTVGIGGKTVTGSHGIAVQADLSEDEYDDTNPEAIILPGGMPGTLNLDASPFVDAVIRNAAEKGILLCAICAAPMVLGKRGLLKGYRATCYPGREEYLLGADVVPNVRDETVVIDRDRITGAGMGVSFPFALAIVQKFQGSEAANAIRHSVIGD